MRIYLIGGAVVLSLAAASNLAFGALIFDGDHHGRDRGWHDRYEQQLDGWTDHRRDHWFDEHEGERDGHRRK